jgi:hypothetical protein
MSLPKIDLPLFELTVPSSGKKVKYRPFNVREEKILLIAQEAGDLDQIVLAIKQIINNCVSGINIDDLPMFDLEFIILNIRAKSVNNEIEFNVIDEETQNEVKLKLDLNNVTVVKNEKHTKKITINDEYTLIMKYPTIDRVKELGAQNSTEGVYNLMVGCIDMLSSNNGDKIYKFSDFTKDEINTFIEELPATSITDIKNFFETIPVLRVEVPYKNSLGNDKVFVLEGLNSFFI